MRTEQLEQLGIKAMDALHVAAEHLNVVKIQRYFNQFWAKRTYNQPRHNT